MLLGWKVLFIVNNLGYSKNKQNNIAPQYDLSRHYFDFSSAKMEKNERSKFFE